MSLLAHCNYQDVIQQKMFPVLRQSPRILQPTNQCTSCGLWEVRFSCCLTKNLRLILKNFFSDIFAGATVKLSPLCLEHEVSLCCVGAAQDLLTPELQLRLLASLLFFFKLVFQKAWNGKLEIIMTTNTSVQNDFN